MCDDKQKEEFEFVKEYGLTMLCSYEGESRTIAVPLEYDGETVCGVSSSFRYMGKYPGMISEIVLHSKIQYMEARSFMYFANLERITVDKDNEYFYDRDGAVFEKGTDKLIFYPNNPYCDIDKVMLGAKSIGSFAFSNSSIEEFIMPDSIASVDQTAFEMCITLQHFEFNNKIDRIPCAMFDGCTGLESVDMKNVLHVDLYAFRGCARIKNIDCSKLLTIGAGAFSGCKYLERVYLNKDVIFTQLGEFGNHAFHACHELKGVTIENGSSLYKSVDGVLFSADGKTLLIYPCGKSDEHFDIPDSVKIISNSAFMNNSYIKSVNTPSSVIEIQKQAFARCGNLQEVKMSGGIENIARDAFYNCNKLELKTQ
ncbi:MAG: leucine-rich repeat protein [Bacillota bacterium]